MAGKSRSGAVRKSKKGPSVGTGGHVRKGLEGKGPTPKAIDRSYHPAGKKHKAAEAKLAGQKSRRVPRERDSRGKDVIFGRNSVFEALQAKVPGVSLYVLSQSDRDSRVRDIIHLALGFKLPIVEVEKQVLDGLASGGVHQGVALEVSSYVYSDLSQMLDRSLYAYRNGGKPPVFLATDGITDPRNLGAIVRSIAAFGANGVILPERRSVGVNATVWKTSVGAVSRVPVAQVVNLRNGLELCKKKGFFVIGLDAMGEVSLPDFSLKNEPLVLVAGSEGGGVSRLISETCDQMLSIPISRSVESLNVGVAVSVVLFSLGC